MRDLRVLSDEPDLILNTMSTWSEVGIFFSVDEHLLARERLRMTNRYPCHFHRSVKPLSQALILFVGGSIPYFDLEVNSSAHFLP